MGSQPKTQMETDSARALLRHTLATLAYRGGKTIRDVPQEFGSFQLTQGSPTPAKILAHMGDLLDWALSMMQGKPVWKVSETQSWEADVARFHSALQAFDGFLASEAPLHDSIENIFQGPVADALTHVGQLAMLRRLAGAPIAGENYHRAEIRAGCVGADQPPPRQPFK